MTRSFLLPESTPHYRPERGFHVEHVSIDLDLDFDKQRISATCALKVRPMRPGSTLALDAVSFDISKVKVDGKESEYRYDGDQLFVPFTGEEARTIEVWYSASPKEGVYFTGPDSGNPETEVQAWTHNEAEFARHWFPCYDHPDDKSSSELKVTVPKEFRVISNGVLVSSEVKGEKATFHWVEKLPHSTYLTSFVAGKFGEIAQEAGETKLQYYFPERKRKDALRYFGETPEMVKVFEELTGVKYPYSKYSQTTVEDFIFGGMENFNATTLTMSYYPDENSEEDFQSSYSTPHRNAVNLVAHELAHQWFGDLVTCADWSHAWLNEGFATYFQALYLERSKGEDEFRCDLEARAAEYFEEDKEEYRRPIVEKRYVYPDDVFDNTLYEKGAAMLHELRYIMGDGAFFRGISEYLKANSFGSVDTHDLMRAMEKSSGLSLEQFFDQAFFRPGFPELDITYSWDEGSGAATVHLKQMQSREDGTPTFRLPAEIVYYSGGKRASVKFVLGSGDQTLTFFPGKRPSVVEFDPERWLLKKVNFKKDLEMLVNQLKESSDASSRSDAARALGEAKSATAIVPLKEASLHDGFWDVRAKCLVALAEVGTPDALQALLDIGLPKERRVRRALAKSLGYFKGEQARDRLLDLLRSDESPYVRCEAALSLAKSWPEGAFAELKEAMKAHTPNETLAEACLDAMGKLHDPGVVDLVRDKLSYGNPQRVRIGALKAIKGRGTILESEVPILKQMLRGDKEHRVRVFLVNDLIRRLGDTRFLESVKEVSETDKDPRVRRKALETVHELSGPGLAATVSRLKAEVEELKAGDGSSRRQSA